MDPIAAFVVFLCSFSALLWGSVRQHPLCRQAAGFSVSGQHPLFNITYLDMKKVKAALLTFTLKDDY